MNLCTSDRSLWTSRLLLLLTVALSVSMTLPSCTGLPNTAVTRAPGGNEAAGMTRSTRDENSRARLQNVVVDSWAAPEGSATDGCRECRVAWLPGSARTASTACPCARGTYS